MFVEDVIVAIDGESVYGCSMSKVGWWSRLDCQRVLPVLVGEVGPSGVSKGMKGERTKERGGTDPKQMAVRPGVAALKLKKLVSGSLG